MATGTLPPSGIGFQRGRGSTTLTDFSMTFLVRMRSAAPSLLATHAGGDARDFSDLYDRLVGLRTHTSTAGTLSRVVTGTPATAASSR